MSWIVWAIFNGVSELVGMCSKEDFFVEELKVSVVQPVKPLLKSVAQVRVGQVRSILLLVQCLKGNGENRVVLGHGSVVEDECVCVFDCVFVCPCDAPLLEAFVTPFYVGDSPRKAWVSCGVDVSQSRSGGEVLNKEYLSSIGVNV